MSDIEPVRRVRIDMSEVLGLGVEPIDVVIRSRLRRADFDLKREITRSRCPKLGRDVWEYRQEL